jgi:hypothetical protein
MNLALRIIAGLALGASIHPANAQSFIEVDRVELTDIDPATDNGRLGRQLALSGNTAMSSAPFKDGQKGAVYVFDLLPDGMLSFRQALQPTATFSQFGTSLALDGDWAAVADSLFSARVRLFRRSGASWVEAQTLRLSDVPATANITLRALGTSLSISGDLLVAGDTRANVVSGGGTVDNAGAVVLFRRGGDNIWRHEATLTAPSPSNASSFGAAAALSNSTLLVGAENDKLNGQTVGGAYVFQRSGGNWTHARTLRNPDAAEQGTRYGWSVALDGDLAVVGCATCLVLSDPGDPSNTGSFFGYERNLGGAGNWGLRGEFFGSAPDFIDNFSTSLHLVGSTLLVGASGSKQAVFFTRATDGNWEEAALLQSGDPNTTNFGVQVAFTGGRAVIGADAFPDMNLGSDRWGSIHAWFGAVVEACRGNFEAIFCDGYESFD